MKYDVVIIGAGPGGIFSAYELMKQNNDLKIAVFEAGNPLSKRHCPIDGDKVKTCIKCKTCAIMRDLAVPVLSLMANIISRMISAERFMNISEKKKLLT